MHSRPIDNEIMWNLTRKNWTIVAKKVFIVITFYSLWGHAYCKSIMCFFFNLWLNTSNSILVVGIACNAEYFILVIGKRTAPFKGLKWWSRQKSIFVDIRFGHNRLFLQVRIRSIGCLWSSQSEFLRFYDLFAN